MKYFIILIPLLFTIGCTTGPQLSTAALNPNTKQISTPEAADSHDEDTIVKNIVFALAQLPELHPFSTTLTLKRATTPLAQLIETRFIDAGYGVRYVESDEGEYYVRHSALNSLTENGKTTTYGITVGSITAERDFGYDEKGTYPSSVLRIQGASKIDIVLYDAVFGGRRANSQHRQVYFDVNDDPVLVNLENDELVTQTPQKREFGNLIKRNMQEILASNYVEIFDNYEDIDQSVLVFQNDSLRIGDENKETVKSYVQTFNPDTDILSVVGCSHGNAKALNRPGSQGNQLLAVGRANRVKEALIFAGIGQEYIYDEACWDDEYYDEMPRRGVVLTHKRRVSNG